MKKSTKRKSFSEQLRRAILESGQTRYRIGVETGITQSTLSRFAAGKTGLSLPAIDKIVDHLGLVLVPDESETSPRRKGR